MTAPDEFPKLLDSAHTEASELTTRCIADHGLAAMTGWSLDEAKARLLFTDANSKFALMKAQMVGFYEPATRLWQWAWSDASIAADLLQAVSYVRTWGTANGIAMLTDATSKLDVTTAAKLTAFTARFIGWPGIYGGEVPGKIVFMAFAPTREPKGPDVIEPVTPLQPKA